MPVKQDARAGHLFICLSDIQWLRGWLIAFID